MIKTSLPRSAICNAAPSSVMVRTAVPSEMERTSPVRLTLPRSNCAPPVLKNFRVSPSLKLKSLTVSFVDVFVNWNSSAPQPPVRTLVPAPPKSSSSPSPPSNVSFASEPQSVSSPEPPSTVMF